MQPARGSQAVTDAREQLAAIQGARVNVGAVTLSSIHASKGLEYDYVFIAGCSDGLIPYHRANNEDGIEEERRLFYVAVTRAMKGLYISYAITKDGGLTRRASRFIQ